MFGLAKCYALVTQALATLSILDYSTTPIISSDSSVIPVTPLYAAYGTKKLLPLEVLPNGTVTLAHSSSLVTRFFISDSKLYAANVVDTPHAYVSFDHAGLGCSVKGPVVFSKTNSNKCSESEPFTFDGNFLVFGAEGSFQLCGSGSGQHLAYSTSPSSPSSGCTNINLVQA